MIWMLPRAMPHWPGFEISVELKSDVPVMGERCSVQWEGVKDRPWQLRVVAQRVWQEGRWGV